MANKHCLEDMMCPTCGAEEPFKIAVCATVVMWDEGSDPEEGTGDLEWEAESYCKCMTCQFVGQVRDFQDVPTVACKFCDVQVLAATAHLHQGSYVGERCCWDDRLKMSE